ncbi:MAG: beta-Ala-His dipeptidase [Lachnospiraceae bacterium]|nr:beta-Ala-His dipeptidase [Lachnospiraceae bacterium]
MGVLDDIQPQSVFRNFEKLTQIPHGSGNVRAISDYLTEFARKRGYETVQDEALNVRIRIPATPGKEDIEPLILQGHMDMVAVRDEGAAVDPAVDPLKLRVDGDVISAEGTSLGADDGIAVAFFCALMEDPSIEHPELYLLVTTDEETGMDGARSLDPELLAAKYLINIDSEDEGILLAGCAGGGRVHITMRGACGEVRGIPVTVQVTGLLGGHSGSEIDRERGNANLIAGRLLLALSDAGCDFSLKALSGGSADNAIPPSSVMELVVPAGDEQTDRIREVLKKTEQEIGAELGSKDPDFHLVINIGDTPETVTALAGDDTARAAGLIVTLPSGIQAMSADLPGLVETSLNLGVMRLETGDDAILHLDLSVRSSRESARDLLIRRVRLLAETFGAQSSVHGVYPGWVYDPDSVICAHFCAVYERLTGKKARVKAIHAGVECGLFKEKRKDLDCVSFGPDLEQVHTTGEKLHIASTVRTWEFLREALSAFAVRKERSMV